ncbi:MAG: TolC family protein [Alphaproteobacteria bacterium]|nr:TolC family protein [Alphaproteobacteria bacterium]
MLKIKHLSMLGLLSPVFFAPGAYALDLSLNDAIEKIVAESQDMKKADANLKKAQAQLTAANANRWFKIDGSATYMNMVNVENPSKSTGIDLPPAFGGLISESLKDQSVHIEIPDNILMVGVSASQPIYTFGKIGNAVKSVKAAIKMTQSSREMTLREVRYSAANVYWTAKMTDEIVRISAADLRDARDARRNLGAAGRASRANLVKIESDIATKEINLSDAEFNRDTAYRMLKILAGIDMDTEITLTDNFPATFAGLNAGPLKNTPEWDILNQQIQMYESKAKSSRAGYLPTLAATASYSFMAMGPEYDTMFERSGSQSAYWGLALQMPIFSGGAVRANATMDAMDAEAARQDLDKSKKMKTEEYNNAVLQYNHLRGNMDKLQEARNLAAKAYRFSQERFAAGQTSAIELSEASAGLYQLDMALLNSKYKIVMAAESVKKIGE